MKTAKWISIAIVATLLCASVITAIRPSGGSADSNNSTEEVLTITATYGSDGEFFEIGKDIVAATDSDFANTLRMKSCNVSGSEYIYSFAVEDLSSLDTIYIKPPVLYKPVEISPVTVPISGEADTDLFAVKSAEVRSDSNGLYAVVSIDLISKDLPRLTKLRIGDSLTEGSSSMQFDENGEFTSGEFTFYIGADSVDDAQAKLSDASLVVSDILMRVDSCDMQFSSSESSLSIVVASNEHR